VTWNWAEISARLVRWLIGTFVTWDWAIIFWSVKLVLSQGGDCSSLRSSLAFYERMAARRAAIRS